jgi:hypothetical protein
MEPLKGIDFGQLIAFILPGTVAARALAYYLPSIQQAIDKASTGGEGSIGPLIWFFFVAATCGLTISVTRQQWLDPLFGWIYGKFKDAPQNKVDGQKKNERPSWRPNYVALRESTACAELFEKSVNQVYRYYQFAANLALSFALITVARYWAPELLQSRSNQTTHSITIGSGVVALSLFLTAYQQFKGWCRVHNQITGGVSVAPKGSSPSGAISAAAPAAIGAPKGEAQTATTPIKIPGSAAPKKE